MIELTRKTFFTLKDFMDQADEHINVEDTLWALADPREEGKRGERRSGQFDRKIETSRQGKKPDRHLDHNLRLHAK